MINTIIFDFGGVILNIDFQKTIDAFEKLGMENAREMYSKNIQNQLFLDLEKGSISPETFRKEIRKFLKKEVNDSELDEAWNALLCDLPAHRIHLLEKIKNNYTILLLSNTNIIHYNHYVKDIQKLGYQDYDALFHHAVFSFKVGLIKPHQEIWDFMISEFNLNPKQALFIDDSLPNVESAEKSGFKGFHLGDGKEFSEIFTDDGLLIDMLKDPNAY